MSLGKEQFGNSARSGGSEIYKRMIEEIEDYAIILLDTDGIIRNWNKGAQKIKLYTEKEILGQHFSIFYLQEDLDTGLPQKLMNEAREMGRAGQEGWRKRKDGTHFWGSITITALHGEDSSVIGFCKVTRDLSDKKAAEDRLRMSEERYHRMIAEVQDYAIILLSAEGVVENWNAGAENIKGYKSNEIIGRKFEVFYTQEDRASGLPHSLLAKARQEGKATHEGWRIRNDGTKFWGSITITALHDKAHEVIGFSKVTRDLTQQKIARDKLAAYTAELEIQNSELEQFAYIASHDLQEPLRKIQTFTELIKDNLYDQSIVGLYIEKLASSARRMSELVRSLLNYSRITKDSDRLSITDVDLNQIVEEVKVDLELLIAEKSAVIEYQALPVIQGNKTQFRQLFANLIGNSLKYSSQKPVVAITAGKVEKYQIEDAPEHLTANEYWHLSFEDNGIGFEDQYSKKIFVLFQRLHGKQDYSGTGIGLALCKRIVDSYNGCISASGKLGEGATFDIYLPLSYDEQFKK